MKKIVVLLLAGFTFLSVGCAAREQAEQPFTTSVGGGEIVVSFNEGTKSAGTITAGHGTYSFSYDLDGTLTIVYPNGYTYAERKENGITVVSWPYPEKAEKLGYLHGFVLSAAIAEAMKSTKAGGSKVPVLVSILILLVGIWFFFFPRSVWWLARGRHYQNVEPSQLSLTLYRLLGLLVTVAGIISFFS